MPARVVATLMVLQAFEALSDREACGRLEADLRWQAAAGVDVGHRAFHPTLLVGVRNRPRASARRARSRRARPGAQLAGIRAVQSADRRSETAVREYAAVVDPGGLLATRRARCSIRVVLMVMISCCRRSFPLVPAAEWVCHVDAACPLAGARSADHDGDQGDVWFPEDRAAAGGAGPGPAGPVGA